MEKLREMVMKVASADQKKILWASQIAQIEEQLQNAFPSGLHTPIHPPYPAMIHKAITELNEDGGSSEESISECIKAEYKDLPFAHKSFLSLHLRKLCDKGFIALTAGKHYMIRNLTAMHVGKKTRPIKRKHGLNHVTPSSEDNGFENEESKKIHGRKRNKAKRELFFEEEDDEHELCNAVITKMSLTRELMLNEHGESCKGLVKRKKKDMMKWMINAFSDLPDEENLKGNQIINYKERKDPSYLQSLVQTRFFAECKVHSDADINKCNSFCLDCMNGALCNSCRISHEDHNLIRINRSVWENAVVAHHIQMYIDISGIQAHHMNGRILLSLKRTVQSRHRKHFTAACFICKRHLPESFKFCSLYCKFVHDQGSDAPSTTS